MVQCTKCYCGSYLLVCCQVNFQAQYFTLPAWVIHVFLCLIIPALLAVGARHAVLHVRSQTIPLYKLLRDLEASNSPWEEFLTLSHTVFIPTFWNEYMRNQRCWTMVFQLCCMVPVQKFENKVFDIVFCLTFSPVLSNRAQFHRIEFWGQDRRNDQSNLLWVTLCVWTVHRSRCPKMNAFWSSH